MSSTGCCRRSVAAENRGWWFSQPSNTTRNVRSCISLRSRDRRHTPKHTPNGPTTGADRGRISRQAVERVGTGVRSGRHAERRGGRWWSVLRCAAPFCRVPQNSVNGRAEEEKGEESFHRKRMLRDSHHGPSSRLTMSSSSRRSGTPARVFTMTPRRSITNVCGRKRTPPYALATASFPFAIV
jgi:transposase InsO family protein